MRSTYLAGVSLLASLSIASPLQSFNGELMQKRQAPGPGNYYAITGATGGVHPRLEIRELQKTGEMWNLYLLAMTEFQAMDQDTIDSYYQIAGIHGMPWIPWDGVQGKTEDRYPHQLGYCPHNQPLFATWHRPYVSLFEQKLQQIAINIANQFKDATAKSKHQAAAQKLRAPFWDWAKALPTSEPVLPTALSDEKVKVTKPDGTTATIDNPLYDYNFHPLVPEQINGTGCAPANGQGGSPAVCDTFDHTIRASFEINDNAELNKRLRDILDSQRKYLFKILSQYQTFDRFTSNSFSCGPGQGGAGYLENVHGNIHTRNYPGHMSPTGVTAFDPQFWLHHANVDRQLALFQALYPNTYMGSCTADTPTYTVDSGEALTADSALTPFHKNKNGDFWTSADVRDITKMGYTYPELVNTNNATLVAYIKAQYSGPPDVAVPNKKRSLNDVVRRQDAGKPKKEVLYLAEVELPVYGFDNGNGGSSPYEVFVFVGEVSGAPSGWTKLDSFVGMTSALGGPLKNDMIKPSNVEVGEALKKAVEAGKTTTEKAEDYLKENLKFRVAIGDVEIPREKIPGLKLNLISTQVEIAQSDDTFDRWVGGFKEHGQVDA